MDFFTAPETATQMHGMSESLENFLFSTTIDKQQKRNKHYFAKSRKLNEHYSTPPMQINQI